VAKFGTPAKRGLAQETIERRKQHLERLPKAGADLDNLETVETVQKAKVALMVEKAQDSLDKHKINVNIC
jgi:hypothetical protein